MKTFIIVSIIASTNFGITLMFYIYRCKHHADDDKLAPSWNKWMAILWPITMPLIIINDLLNRIREDVQNK